MSFKIIRNDITKIKADAVVNTANPEVTVGSGVDSAIYRVAGKEQLLEARRKIGHLSPGEVGVTEAFSLDADYIIHVSGPRWQGGNGKEKELLRSCYDSALLEAKRHGCKSIAFPLLATGAYGFPKELGMQIAVDSFTSFLEENEMEITLAVFGPEELNISGTLVDEVRSFIDDSYVREAMEEEYGFEKPSGRERRPMSSAVCREISCYGEKPEGSLDEALKNIYTDSFEKHLQKLIHRKGLKNSEVYAAANISKQYFSKLLKGQVKPSKEKVLALAVGLRLNMDETADFLRMAGYALSPISQTDTVVEYFIRNKDYNVLKIDIVLFDYGLDPLSNS